MRNLCVVGDKKVVGDGSRMNVRTSRIGLLSIHATAPVINGEVSETRLEFTVQIDSIATGNPLLDPELQELIRQLTEGTLTFSGERTGEAYVGKAQAGTISVPLTLTATGDGPLELNGTSHFDDLHLPLPGLGHIKHLEVDIDGRLHLA